MKEIKFNQDKDDFSIKLNHEVSNAITKEEMHSASILLWIKLFFYTFLSIASIILVIFLVLKVLEDNVVYFLSPTEIYNQTEFSFEILHYLAEKNNKYKTVFNEALKHLCPITVPC